MSRWLRRVCVVGGAAWLFAVGAVPVFASDGSTRVARHGIELVVPAGWWTSDQRMSSGVEPVFRMTLSDRRLRRTALDSGPCYGGIARQIQPDGVVAILREALGADFKRVRFQLRPRRFVLPPRKPLEDNSCLGDHATLIVFKQANRGFYLWIAAGRNAPKARIDALLKAVDSMTIAPKRPHSPIMTYEPSGAAFRV